MKRHITIPLLLLIYLAAVAYFAYPAKNPTLSYTQYFITLGVTLAVIIAASYFIRKKDENAKKYKKKDKD